VISIGKLVVIDPRVITSSEKKNESNIPVIKEDIKCNKIDTGMLQPLEEKKNNNKKRSVNHTYLKSLNSP